MSAAPAPLEGPAIELARLELLKSIKSSLKIALDDEGRLSGTPFDAPIVTYSSKVDDFDVPDIHRRARQRTLETIRTVREDGRSRVVLVSGSPGMGKTHLLQTIRTQSRRPDLGFIYMCQPNDWDESTLEPALLDGILEALTHSDPGEDLLLQKIAEVALAALGQLLEQKGRLAEYLPHGALGWLRVFRPARERLTRLLGDRDLKVFRHLDFRAFSGFVCDRFLDRPSNPMHRYVLRVLLRYVFEADREVVVHWLRGCRTSGGFEGQVADSGDELKSKVPSDEAVDRVLLGATGAVDHIRTRPKATEVIRILANLFSQEVAGKLHRDSPDQRAPGSRVFVLAFDQAEARDAILGGDELQWRRLFARLSELYNGLPNVVILLTIPLELKKRLWQRMEQQFKDRMIDDPDLALSEVSNEEVLSLYAKRLEKWIGQKRDDSLRENFERINDPYVPLGQGGVISAANEAQRNLRGATTRLADRFVEYFLSQVTLDPETDFMGRYVQLLALVAKSKISLHESHLGTMKSLLEWKGTDIFSRAGLTLESLQLTQDPERLSLSVRDADNLGRTTVHVACLPYFGYREAYENIKTELLYMKHRRKNRWWLLRAGIVSGLEPDSRYPNLHVRQAGHEVEALARALLHLKEHEGKYPPEALPLLTDLILAKLGETGYFADALEDAKRILAEERQLTDSGRRRLEEEEDEQAGESTPAPPGDVGASSDRVATGTAEPPPQDGSGTGTSPAGAP